MRLFRPALLGELILMEESPNPPESSKSVDSRRPGLIGLGLLAAALLGFAAGQWFRPAGPEAERLPAPSVPSVFYAPKLVVYQEGPTIPQLWLDTFGSAPGHLKVEIRPLSRAADGSWPTDGDVYLLKARSFAEVGQSVPWADLSARIPLDGINPVYQAQSFDPNNLKSRPWRVSPWFFMKRVAPGTPHKVAFAAPARWANEAGGLFPNEPDVLAALWIKSQGRPINHGGETVQASARQQAEAVLAARTATEEDCWRGLKDGQVQLTFLPAWRLVLDPQAGAGLIRWAVLPSGTIVDFEVAAIRRDSPRLEMAMRFVEFLLAPPQQAALLGATGYFPVRSRPGHEWAGSTLIVPSGTWFDRSEFILWPYPRPVVVPPPVTATNAVVPESGSEPKSE
ncbi:MAG: extracellular solute-binding protein [Verrucomicrobia bacterium]|nr:extracellular solute-binding protein [Verrucomicrobiota bacterium]